MVTAMRIIPATQSAPAYTNGPRIVGHERETLKEDMVIMVEPTAFDPNVGGVRLEYMLHVTATGCEILTDFEHRPVFET